MNLPSKQKLTVQENTFECICSGSGSPTIVLINGAGGPLEGWHKLYPMIETLSTVFAYNRLGTGGSDRPTAAQTGEVIVTQLHDLLVAVEVPPPYLLVGHSLGGLYANLFARTYPDAVAGVIFLDAAAPGDEVLRDQYQTTPQKLINKIFSLFDGLFNKKEHSEIHFVPETIERINNAGAFPSIPLTVLSGGKRPPSLFMSEEAYQIRQKNQQSLVALSPYGEQVIAKKSGHFPQFSEPEQVIQVIQDMVEKIRPR